MTSDVGRTSAGLRYRPGMNAQRLTGHVGAVVDGVDLTTIADPGSADSEQLLDLLAEHGVLFFRGQNLSDAQHVALANALGGAVPFPLSRFLPGEPKLVGVIQDHAASPPDADLWHTDVTWVQDPPAYAVLQALEIPPYGGDTMWTSLESVYERLSEPMQRLCDSLTALHAPGKKFVDANRRIFGPELADQIEVAFPGVHHPFVRSHPRTGRKSLFYSSFIDSIDGLTRVESDLLLGHIRRLLDDGTYAVRWHWTPGDVAIWDEANTNHRALADHFALEPQNRRMQRAVVRGEAPYFDATKR